MHSVKGRWTVTGACGPYNLGGSTTFALPKGHTFTYRHRIEQQSCSTAQNRPAHKPHLQQGSTNPEYKSTQ